ncbi:MAG: CoA pyrophosphatase [Planctomycetes bacterium]|nr:CoA pyrophosphatase [Planctomycetota bacterium]
MKTNNPANEFLSLSPDEFCFTVADALRSRKRVQLRRQDALTPAAVLFCVEHDDDDGYHLILTERSTRVENHRGQVSFPGGRMDIRDPTPVACALRESYEEIGLVPRDVEPLGLFDDYPTITFFAVTPVIGLVRGRKAYSAEENEVARILRIPFEYFISGHGFETTISNWQGYKYQMVAYNHEEARIWGFTAMLIHRFINEVFGIRRASFDAGNDLWLEQFL